MATVGGGAPVARVTRAHHVRIGWVVEALAVLALLAVGTATVVVLTRSSTAPAVTETARTNPLYTAEERAVIRLVAQGLIPEETLEGGRYVLKRLVNQGLVPREALEPASVRVAPLYSSAELAILSLVRQGLVPDETLDSKTFLLKRLVNAGLIPRQSLLPRRETP